MFNEQEIQEVGFYLDLIFDWDDESAKLWKSVTWTFQDKDGKRNHANYAAQSKDDLIRLIANRKARNTDVYVCLGGQKTASVERYATDGFPAAIRQKNNIVSLKCLWLDIDVKPTAYATTDDAFAALDDFCRVTGMPAPTMEIQSGSGGLHVYWCFDKAVPAENWEPLAASLQGAALKYGLQFDPQVTVNKVGILRVPQTFNYKRTPPSLVYMYDSEDGNCPIYSYQQLVGVLGVRAQAMHSVPKGNKANPQRSSNFGAGIQDTAPPVPIDDVAINCEVIHDILERGGDGDAEPLWNMAMLAASFTTDPRDAAHRMSQDDPRYVAADTDKKLQEKIDARLANPALGWPTCEQFSKLHPACASCPFFAARKTPFHHVPTDKPSSNQPDVVPVSDISYLPDGYWLNRQGHIYTLVTSPKGEQFAVCVVSYPIINAAITPRTETLQILALVSGDERWLEIDVSTATQPHTAGTALYRHGLFIPAKSLTAARDLLVAWVGHLQKIKRHKSLGAYGWQNDEFAYDDRIFYTDRVESVYRGKKREPAFTSKGELKPWQDAMSLVYGNTALEVVVASAFAAPLVELIGSSSLVLSIWSGASGVGKTTAMMLGQSVWGDPRTGMSALADTTNSTMVKVQNLKSLPVYWDELKTKDQIDKAVDLVFQVTQGKGKQRLNRDATQGETGSFTTMFIVASNHGIADAVYRQTESTEAGGLRVFEIPAPASITKTTDDMARRLVKGIEANYGVAGPTYVEYLMRNLKKVQEALKKVDRWLDEELELKQKERFWWMTVTTLLVGAVFANEAGVARFDIPRLRAYLIEMLKKQRGSMVEQQYSTMQTTTDVVALITELTHELRNRHLIITETIPYSTMRGKPKPNNLVDTDMQRVGKVWMQVGLDGRIRVGVSEFRSWLSKRNINPNQIIETLKGRYYVTKSKQTIGAGVPGLDALAKLGRFECYDLTPLPSGQTPSHDSDEQS